jgi:AbrB family looped-hinge helix DNA binding protein
METTLLSSKGQVIIPKAIRSSHHWKPGTRFVVEDVQGGVLLKPLSSFPATDLQSGLGCAGYKGPAKSLDEMQAAIDDELSRSWRKEELR